MEWISVNDRLPEFIEVSKYNLCSKRVLIYHGKISVGVYWKWGNGEYFSSCEEEFYEDVTHWMPLPEPPIEKVDFPKDDKRWFSLEHTIPPQGKPIRFMINGIETMGTYAQGLFYNTDGVEIYPDAWLYIPEQEELKGNIAEQKAMPELKD